jgi:hypothetical protein
LSPRCRLEHQTSGAPSQGPSFSGTDEVIAPVPTASMRCRPMIGAVVGATLDEQVERAQLDAILAPP